MTRRIIKGFAPLAAGIALILGAPTGASAQEEVDVDEAWLLNAQGTATRSAHEPSTEYFMPGGSAALGLYRSLSPYVQLGGRVSGLIVPADEAPPSDITHSGDLTMGTFTGMIRVRPFADPFEEMRSGGLYIEAGGGPALVGDDFTGDPEVTGAVDVGLGWNFPVEDAFSIGPNLRYMQAFEADDRFVGEDPRIWMAGLEFAFLGDVNPPMRPVAQSPDTNINVTVSLPEGQQQSRQVARYRDADWDRVADRYDQCPEHAEVFNSVNDHDGCPDTAEIALGEEEDTVVIDEAVFFPYDKATLTDEGLAALRDIAASYHDADARWDALILRGHADTRGDAAYNARLSQNRVNAVKSALVKMGLPERMIFTEAYGESAPLAEGGTAMAHHLNRRVEFVISR